MIADIAHSVQPSFRKSTKENRELNMCQDKRHMKGNGFWQPNVLHCKFESWFNSIRGLNTS